MANKGIPVSLGVKLPKASTAHKDQLGNSLVILENAIHSAESFLLAFQELRRSNHSGGAPTDHQQDLLRASLIFACAGVDALIKQLIRDALPKVMQIDDGARSQLHDYVKKSLSNKDKPDLDLISKALLADEPTTFFKERLCHQLTSESLQSVEQILSAGSYFDIESGEIAKDVDTLKGVFRARNEISHEMDVNLNGRNRKRRSRTLDDMKNKSKRVLDVGISFYLAVERKLTK